MSVDAAVINPLGTREQIDAEALALQLVEHPEISRQKEQIAELLRGQPAFATPDGKATLSRAVNDMAYAVAVIVAGNRDPDRPAAIWTTTAPHEWFGTSSHGSGGGFDNPDSVYQIVPVDWQSRYEIVLRPFGPAPKMYSLYLYDSIYGDSKKHFDRALGGFRENELQLEADGAFHISLGPDGTSDRRHHIQSTPDARGVIFRNMFDDWARQMPLGVEIRRAGGPPMRPADDREMAHRTAEILAGHAHNLIVGIMRKGTFGSVSEPNTLSKPFGRGGGWGYSARGVFDLQGDQALLITVANVPGQYLGIQVTDPWLHSVESVRASGSLNNHQAEPNRDGSFSFVVSVHDPGVRNWLCTDGLHQGELLVRWQDLPGEMASGAVRDVRVVEPEQVREALPMMSKVTRTQRAADLTTRARHYARRYRSVGD